jgi:hypothetical protein
MALVFGDSFDHYAIADIGKKWTIASGNHATDSMDVLAPVYPHLQSLLLPYNGGVLYLEKTLPATQETFIAGCWYRQVTGYADIILAFIDTATEHVSVRVDAGGHLTLTRNATVLATSTNTLTSNTWYHIEVKVTIGDAGDSPSGRYQVRVNGSATNWIVDSGTGQDTRNGGNKSISAVRIYSSSNNSGAHHFQDFYILDTSGSVAADFIGPCRFALIRPGGAGASAQFSGNYADNFINVADRVADGDNTFNQDSTPGHIDSFVMSDPPAGTIFGIQHVLMARQDAGPARTVRPKTRISSTPYNGTTVALSPTYQFITEARSVSPASGVAWTSAEIAAAEFGYELVS